MGLVAWTVTVVCMGWLTGVGKMTKIRIFVVDNC